MNTLIQKDICIPMFNAALFIIAKIWKQLKCWSIDQWIKKIWYGYYTYTYIYTHTHTHTHSVIKKNEMLPFAVTWMSLECLMLSELNQRKTNTTWFHSCGIQETKQIKKKQGKQKTQTFNCRKQTDGYQGSMVGVG